MNVQQVVLQNKSRMLIPSAQLVRVAQALQIQVERDLSPFWGKHASVSAIAFGDPVPEGAWPIQIVDTTSGLGVHLDGDGNPCAQVKATADWSVSASHELLEMLVDPFGKQLFNAPSLDPDAGGRRVQYLVEICDPCESLTYTIGDVEVSDFVLPAYYDVAGAPGEVDFLGRMAGPLDVPPGGYISWLDPTDGCWHQKAPDGSLVRAGEKADPGVSPRADRDAKLPEERSDRHDLSIIRASAAARAPRRSGAPRPAIEAAPRSGRGVALLSVQSACDIEAA